jgi:hypothetical protein
VLDFVDPVHARRRLIGAGREARLDEAGRGLWTHSVQHGVNIKLGAGRRSKPVGGRQSGLSEKVDSSQDNRWAKR